MRIGFKYMKKTPIVLPLINCRASDRERSNRIRVIPRGGRRRAITEAQCSTPKLKKTHRINELNLDNEGKSNRLHSEISSPRDEIFKILNSIISGKSQKCLTQGTEALPLQPIQITLRNYSDNKQRYFSQKGEPLQFNNYQLDRGESCNFKSDRQFQYKDKNKARDSNQSYVRDSNISNINGSFKDCIKESGKKQIISSKDEYISKSKLLKNKLKQRLLQNRSKEQILSGQNTVKSKGQAETFKDRYNYAQWRRLYIEKLKPVKYQESSFELESQRVQKYISKNQQTLKKYFQSKQFLNKLIQSSPRNEK